MKKWSLFKSHPDTLDEIRQGKSIGLTDVFKTFSDNDEPEKPETKKDGFEKETYTETNFEEPWA